MILVSDPRPDDIKTRYHPHAGLATRIDHFEDYGHEDDNIKPTTVDHDPLSSFGTRVEFDFAEIALEACLNRTQLDALLSVVDRIRKGEPFGFRKSKDVEAAWERASQAQEGVRTSWPCYMLSLLFSHSFRKTLLLKRTRRRSIRSMSTTAICCRGCSV